MQTCMCVLCAKLTPNDLVFPFPSPTGMSGQTKKIPTDCKAHKEASHQIAFNDSFFQKCFEYPSIKEKKMAIEIKSNCKLHLHVFY